MDPERDELETISTSLIFRDNPVRGIQLPFCSHNILKHRELLDTKQHEERANNRSSFLMLFATPERCRHVLERTHNPNALG